MKTSPLDNPAWFALTGPQNEFAVGEGRVLRYEKDALPFVAFETGYEEHLEELNEILTEGEIIYLIGELPELPDGWKMIKEFPCAQMIFEGAEPQEDLASDVSELTKEHRKEIYDLVQEVQPGFFAVDTARVGKYFGIFDQRKLVAVAGERMRPPGFSELSAICTLPEYTGRGYAQKLMDRLCGTNLKKNITPFLHVQEVNSRAIRLYQYKGFVTRRKISFWRIGYRF